MNYRKNPPSADELRRLAKERFHSQARRAASSWTEGDMDQLIEALEIHQIELELQNEHLNGVRAQLERALTLSGELYDFAPVGILTLDRSARITKLNLAAARLLGGERAPLLGCKFEQFLADRERQVFSALLEGALSMGEVRGGEIELSRHGSPESYVQIRMAAHPDSLDFQLILWDITERRKMEEQLRLNSERWELALEAAGDGVWDWNVQTGEMIVSRQFEYLLGFEEHEYGNHLEAWSSRIHPDDKPLVTGRLQDHLAGRTNSFLTEHREQCKDGSWKWIASRGAVVSRSDDGKPLRMVGRHADISERKKTELALEEATQFLQAVFDSLSAHIAVLDRQGAIVQTNAAWRQYGAEQGCAQLAGLIGANYLEFLACVTGDDQQTQQAAAAGIASVMSGAAAHFQLPQPFFAPADKRWFSLHVTRVHDAQERVVVSHEDVSRLKETQEANWRLANTDALTGALSRQNFLNLAEQELARSMRYESPLMLLVLDLDHLKRINDRHGHAMGDSVLQQFVQTLREVLRDSDLIGRIGGGEFAVLLPNTTPAGGRALAERIVTLVRAGPLEAGERCIGYTVSIGGASLSRQPSFPALLALAEAALSRAKDAGRDRLEVEPG